MVGIETRPYDDMCLISNYFRNDGVIEKLKISDSVDYGISILAMKTLLKSPC